MSADIAHIPAADPRGAAQPLVIAVDGPAASGKGTLAKALAGHFHLPYMDTGLLYRAVGQALRDGGHDLHDEACARALAAGLTLDALGNPRLRERAAGEAASRVAAMPGVRQALLHVQKTFACTPQGAVLDGRDIGTVIAPFAPVKFWIDADVRVRAQRRTAELRARGEAVELDQIAADLSARDTRDAPNMRIAPDALRLQTDHLAIEQVFAAALRHIQTIRSA